LKARGGRLSEALADVASHLVAAGHGYLCSADYRDNRREAKKGLGRAAINPRAVTNRVLQPYWQTRKRRPAY
jgi:hypothetical protein